MPRAVTRFEVLCASVELLEKLRDRGRVRESWLGHLKSPNATPVKKTFTGSLIRLVVERHLEHTALLGADRRPEALTGMECLPAHTMIRDLFKRLRQGFVAWFCEHQGSCNWRGWQSVPGVTGRIGTRWTSSA